MERTSGIANPFFIAILPDERFLYSVRASEFGGKTDEEVLAFRIDQSTGALKLLNQRFAKGTATCFLEIDPTGRALLLANYASGSVAALPIHDDGTLGEATSVIQHQGGSKVNPERQDGPHAHCILVGPDHRHAYAADLGLDQILVYRLDPALATLAADGASPVHSSPGAGPRHLAFAPDGKNLYSINELSNTVTRFAVDGRRLERSESLSTLPEDFVGTSYCADLKFTPDGRFLFGTNRGHDSIAIFQVGDGGKLSRSDTVPSLGKGPQNLLITPDGRWLICANMPGDRIVVFHIDPQTGALSPRGEPLVVPRPSCLRMIGG